MFQEPVLPLHQPVLHPPPSCPYQSHPSGNNRALRTLTRSGRSSTPLTAPAAHPQTLQQQTRLPASRMWHPALSPAAWRHWHSRSSSRRLMQLHPEHLIDSLMTTNHLCSMKASVQSLHQQHADDQGGGREEAGVRHHHHNHSNNNRGLVACLRLVCGRECDTHFFCGRDMAKGEWWWWCSCGIQGEGQRGPESRLEVHGDSGGFRLSS